MMGAQALNLETQWTVIDCCRCGCVFAVPASVNRRWRNDSRIWFYCPNGHCQHYSEGTLQREQRLRAEAERRAKFAEKRAQWESVDAEHHKRSAAAYRGHLTRARKRIANGVCPCCKRTFANVHRHMANQHPDFLAEFRQKEAKAGG